LKEKIIEEAKEDEIVWESTDLLRFMTVLLAKSEIRIDDLLAELKWCRLI